MKTDTLQADTVASNRERALSAARRGLDFFVRHQELNLEDANYGRFAFVYDCSQNKILQQTTNWTTGVLVDALLLGYRMFADDAYLEAAARGVSYLRSLQNFEPRDRRFFGTFHEMTPQSPDFHPRDALTAALALLDWSDVKGCEDGLYRARAYADWLVGFGMDADYPRWTVSFDTFAAEPAWYGSFHSGSAFFLARMYTRTGDSRYRDAMRRVLDLYNRFNLNEDGTINVIVDIRTGKPVRDEDATPLGGRLVPVGWIRMHEYNDDFGALANLEAWRITGDSAYLAAAERFLGYMLRTQHADGGFGPEGWAVPAAGGSVLLEMLAARELGSSLQMDDAIERALDYVLNLQVLRPGDLADGAFMGFTGEYTIDGKISNARSAGYAVLSLLRYAGATGPIYFPTPA